MSRGFDHALNRLDELECDFIRFISKQPWLPNNTFFCFHDQFSDHARYLVPVYSEIVNRLHDRGFCICENFKIELGPSTLGGDTQHMLQVKFFNGGEIMAKMMDII